MPCGGTPSGEPLARADIDLRQGGSFCFVHASAEGQGHAFSGTYREVVPPSRLVFATPAPGGGQTLGVLEFQDLGQRTNLVLTMSSATPEARDLLLRLGIDKGTARSLANLDAYLKARAGDTNE